MAKTMAPKLMGDKTPKSIQDLFGGKKDRNDDAKYYGNNEFLQGLYSGYNAGSAWQAEHEANKKMELAGKVVGDYVKGDSTTTSFGNLLGDKPADGFDASKPQFEGLYSNQAIGDKGGFMNFDKANPSAVEQPPVFKQEATQAVTATLPNQELTSTVNTPRDFLKSSRADFMDKYTKAGGNALDAGIIYDNQIAPMVSEAKTNRLGQIIQQYNVEKDPAKKTALEAEYASITQDMYGAENQGFKRNADARAQSQEERDKELHPIKVEGAKLQNENLQTTITGNQMRNNGVYPYATGSGSGGGGGKTSKVKWFNSDGLDAEQAYKVNALSSAGSAEEAKKLKEKYKSQNGMTQDIYNMLEQGANPFDIYDDYKSWKNDLSPEEIHERILSAMEMQGYKNPQIIAMGKALVEHTYGKQGESAPVQTGEGKPYTPSNMPPATAPAQNNGTDFAVEYDDLGNPIPIYKKGFGQYLGD